MKVCVMNCGLSRNDKRTREQMIAECDDCVDIPEKPKHKVGIAIDQWKQPMFEDALSKAGFDYHVKGGVTDNTKTIIVETAEVQRLADVTRSTNHYCALISSGVREKGH